MLLNAGRLRYRAQVFSKISLSERTSGHPRRPERLAGNSSARSFPWGVGGTPRHIENCLFTPLAVRSLMHINAAPTA